VASVELINGIDANEADTIIYLIQLKNKTINNPNAQPPENPDAQIKY
jgi:hypothetical protein